MNVCSLPVKDYSERILRLLLPVESVTTPPFGNDLVQVEKVGMGGCLATGEKTSQTLGRALLAIIAFHRHRL